MRLKAILAILAILFSDAALATNGTWSAVTVTEIVPCVSAYGCSTNGLVQVGFSANSSPSAACATAKAWGTVDVSTPIGAYIAAVLQTARLTGATVTVYGLGSCTLTGIEQIGEVVE